MAKPKPTKMTPQQTKTFNGLCRLRTDNCDVGGFWILHGGDVISFAQQREGESASQTITIPKGTFDRMVAWYQREQKLVAR